MWGFYEMLRFCATTWDDYKDRLVKNTKQKDYEIDTAFCNDTNMFETGIRKLNGDWIIVEEYNSKTDAQKGHTKWEKFITSKPKGAFDVHLEEFIYF